MGSDVWGSDENLNFTYDICDCCGAEAGVDDFNIDVARRYRHKWLDAGSQWFQPSARPVEWNISEQLKQILDRWS
jgi:hypothetical protein